jgi:hypothetical protein
MVSLYDFSEFLPQVSPGYSLFTYIGNGTTVKTCGLTAGMNYLRMHSGYKEKDLPGHIRR